MTCAWCAAPSKGSAMEPEDTSRQPSCGTRGCGIFYKNGPLA